MRLVRTAIWTSAEPVSPVGTGVLVDDLGLRVFRQRHGLVKATSGHPCPTEPILGRDDARPPPRRGHAGHGGRRREAPAPASRAGYAGPSGALPGAPRTTRRETADGPDHARRSTRLRRCRAPAEVAHASQVSGKPTSATRNFTRRPGHRSHRRRPYEPGERAPGTALTTHPPRRGRQRPAPLPPAPARCTRRCRRESVATAASVIALASNASPIGVGGVRTARLLYLGRVAQPVRQILPRRERGSPAGVRIHAVAGRSSRRARATTSAPRSEVQATPRRGALGSPGQRRDRAADRPRRAAPPVDTSDGKLGVEIDRNADAHVARGHGPCDLSS